MAIYISYPLNIFQETRIIRYEQIMEHSEYLSNEKINENTLIQLLVLHMRHLFSENSFVSLTFHNLM